MRILFFGDIVGQPGREAVRRVLPRWRTSSKADIVLANGENAAGGVGITPAVAEELFDVGIDVLTLGNHAFRKKEAVRLLEDDARVLRPANYPSGVPGYGYHIYNIGEMRLGVINLLGRIFLEPIDDPFAAVNHIIPLLREQTPCILIDIHAEATSEKAALAWMVDGTVSAVIGTHTHVATADERLLPKGTAFITDVGMVGPWNSVLGVDHDIVVARFQHWMPTKFDVASGPVTVNAVCISVDETSGKATEIVRMNEIIDLPANKR